MKENDKLLKSGFTAAELTSLPPQLLSVVEQFYSDIELQSLSKEKILKGALLLQEVLNPQAKLEIKAQVGKLLRTKGDGAAAVSHPKKDEALKLDNLQLEKIITEEAVEQTSDTPAALLKPAALQKFLERQSAYEAALMITFLEEKKLLGGELAKTLLAKQQKRQEERSTLFGYFEAYLKKGKKELELLRAKLFTAFRREVEAFLTACEAAPAAEWPLRQRLFFRKESSFKQEKLLVRMAFSLCKHPKLKESLRQVYVTWQALPALEKKSAAARRVMKHFRLS